MGEYRLKIKIGEHEFDADGPADVVKSQFEVFRDLVATIQNRPIKPAEIFNPNVAVTVADPAAETQLNIDRIFRTEGRVVSLTALPPSESDAVLLLMYGQRHYRSNESPTGSEIIDGMEQSGYRTPRIDRFVSDLSDEGALIITGAHRGKRYRLTNQGHARAEGIARQTLGILP
jgi:hypothetical protein